jgi:uncharacterized protein YjbJ (UPF0337 family)
MNKDRVKGMTDEVAGSVKRKVGELTDNPKLQTEGMVQQIKGKAVNALGKTKEVVSDALKSAKLHVDTHEHLGAEDSTEDTQQSKFK